MDNQVLDIFNKSRLNQRGARFIENHCIIGVISDILKPEIFQVIEQVLSKTPDKRVEVIISEIQYIKFSRYITN